MIFRRRNYQGCTIGVVTWVIALVVVRILSPAITYLAVVVTIGCTAARHETSSSRHLTEAQAIELAKPVLPLPAGESYRARFKDGTWEVWTDRAGSQFRIWTVVTIRDSNGKVQGVAHRF